METLDGNLGWKPRMDAWCIRFHFLGKNNKLLDVIGSQPVPFWMEARMVLDVIGSQLVPLGWNARMVLDGNT